MKRVLFALLVVTLCITAVACRSTGLTPTTSQSTTTSLVGATTTSVPTSTTFAADGVSSTTMTVFDPTRDSERLTVSQPFANNVVGELLTKIPWTAAPKASFYAEVPNARGNLWEVFFTTDKYEIWRGYMADTTLIFTDGSRYKQKDIPGLVSNGTVTPDELTALFGLEPRTKSAIDTTTGEARFGVMISYLSRREATVKQGGAEVHIYPPFDFIGEFYKCKYYGDSIGYHVNVEYLNQLITAACPKVGTVDTAQAIRVGDSLFVPLSAATKIGITINVGEKSEEYPSSTPSLQIVLPNA